jgi:type I restriction enzyme S subunit
MSAQPHKQIQDNVPEFKMKWPKVSLGEIVNPVARREAPVVGITYRQIGVKLWGAGAYERETIDGSETKYKTLSRVETDDIIVNKIWARNGSVAVVSKNLAGCYASSEFPLFKSDKDKLEPKWFHWITKTKTLWDQCDEKSRGTSGKNRIRPEKFLEIEIPLPPISEQQRIVAKIEELAAKIQEAHGLRLQAVKEAETIILLSIDHICFKSEFPLCSLGDVLIEAKNGIYKPPEFWGHGIPCIRMYNIEGPCMNINQLKLLDVTPEEFDSYGCSPGDLIFNRVNSAELVGKTGLLTKDYPRCTFESKNMRLRVDNNKILPEYAAIVLNSDSTRDYYRSSLKQQCGMATLNQNHVRAIPLPLPTLSEQRRIVEYLNNLQSKIDKLKRLQSQTQKELDALMPSILDKAFRGEL